MDNSLRLPSDAITAYFELARQQPDLFVQSEKIRLAMAQSNFLQPHGLHPGSSVHGILQARILEWVCHFLLQGIFPTWGSNLCFLLGKQILYHWATTQVLTKPSLCSFSVLGSLSDWFLSTNPEGERNEWERLSTKPCKLNIIIALWLMTRKPD